MSSVLACSSQTSEPVFSRLVVGSLVIYCLIQFWAKKTPAPMFGSSLAEFFDLVDSCSVEYGLAGYYFLFFQIPDSTMNLWGFAGRKSKNHSAAKP